ncbi:AAA family ATPase [Tumidithrix elongata RA019]|uniref:histidine kinase n=1 Tax=Tumidithrix elongata BACA0141 TaxID=2716417 RepID=A0AAW9Q1H9_9CYAN|nr:AAA family ATPase [Tumidithrix elongata RA019]
MSQQILSGSDRFPQVDGYRLTESLFEGYRTLVYRGIRLVDRLPVVVKMLRGDRPTVHDLLRLRNHYTIAKNINLSGIVQPIALESIDHGLALVMPDDRCIALRDYLATNTLALVDFFAIALQLAKALAELYQHRVIHKDIKPSNILIDPTTRQIKLTDFGLASRLPHEIQEIQTPNILEGTLAYLSPEQTGRMNRGIDYRTDFYSLGVTFYELLSGQLPFQSDDPLELVYCHLAKSPIPLESSRIPKVLSDIVMKLLAKNAEDRYQSAVGLKADLEICREQYTQTGAIAAFTLGQVDDLAQFNIPQKLYGREEQVKTLLEVFDRVSQGSCELVLVKGYSGVGKTALVNEILRQLTYRKGYFTSGKFDQYQRNIPLAAVVKAHRGLVSQLLAESEVRLQYWRDRFLDRLGVNGQLIVDLMPELELIIGRQPPVVELGAIESANRLMYTFDRYAQALQSPNHPIVLFMDDGQWADTSSCQSLQGFMQNPENHHWLMMAAYRENEVSPTHPFMQAIKAIRQTGARITEINLEPLDLEDVTHLLAETLHTSAESVNALSQLLLEKTLGNPFFLNQLLKSLHEDGLIWFDATLAIARKQKIGGWNWNLAQIQQRGMTDNVVELMIGKICKLSEPTQRILQLAACIGNTFDLQTLATVSEQSLTQTAQELWEAIQIGAIAPVGEGYRLAQTLHEDEIAGALMQGEAISYCFLHDRVQQAAYSLIAEGEKQATHLTIGRLLWRDTSTEAREERVFEMVNHLNLGISLIEEPQEQENLAALNLAAGHKAKTATAYGTALDYATTGIQLLSPTSWRDRYDLTLQLYGIAAEAAYLTGDLNQMASWVAIVMQQGRTILDRIEVIEITIQSYAAQNRHLEALSLALDTLAQLGVSLSKSPTPQEIQQEFSHVRAALSQRSLDELLNLPSMSDPYKLAASQILANMSGSASIALPALIPIIVLCHLRISMEYGNSPFSAHGYVGYGILVGLTLQDSQTAYQFGQLALQLIERSQAKAIQTKIFQLVGAYIIHRKCHIRETLSFFDRALVSGLEDGDLEFLGYATMTKCQYLYFLGRELTDLNEIMADYNDSLAKLNQAASLSWNQIFRQAVLNLISPSNSPCSLTGELLSEEEFIEAHQAANDRLGLHYFYTHKLILCNLFGDYDQGLENAKQAQLYLDGADGFLNIQIFHFHDSLVRLQNWSVIVDEQRTEFLEAIDANQAKMQVWAENAPMNYQHKWELVEAEKCRVQQQYMEAMELYDRAISGAKAHGYIQEEALANELAAKFYLNWDKPKAAVGYMQSTYECYSRWGAKAKLVDLENRYPQLLAPIFHSRRSQTLEAKAVMYEVSDTRDSQSSSSSSTSTGLDLNTILKASQVLSQEIQLEKLLAKLMHIVMENTGAQTGALILKSETDWRIAIHCRNAETCHLESMPLEGSLLIPLSAIHYVQRTQTVVVIDDVTISNPFNADPYWLNHASKSVFCFPVLNQGKLIGIVYLENQVTAAAFTRDRQELMQLIATQAAISIENAQLYQTLEQKVKERTQELSQVLSNLQSAQTELIQAEKMAALGQLTASVAHEINTPLGVIRSATGNIVAALNISLQQLPALMQGLTSHQQADFIALVNASLQQQQTFSTREERQLRRRLQTELSDLGIIDAQAIASQLALLRIDSGLEAYQSLLKAPNCSNILQLAYKLVQQSQNATSIQQEVDRAAKIVFALKTYSHRSETGEKSFVKITDGIEVALTLYQNRLKQGIEVIRRYVEIPPIFCDPDELTQVWVNLIDNAIYAMGQKGTLEVAVTQRLKQAIVEITDSGCGIPTEIQAKIFEPFVTSKPRGEGSGLGLDIVRQIVQKHDGEIQVKSQLGRTTFSLCFPLLMDFKDKTREQL